MDICDFFEKQFVRHNDRRASLDFKRIHLSSPRFIFFDGRAIIIKKQGSAYFARTCFFVIQWLIEKN